MIKNVIFDMGQVLVKFDPQYFIERAGITDPEDIKTIDREVYKSLDWARMDRGSLTEAEGLRNMCARLPERLHEAARKLTLEWERPILPIDGMAGIIKELHENGYKIYLLSNASYRQIEYWHKIPGSEYFDGRVVSADEKLVKPQPEIYKLICDRYNLVPGECVFIDDSQLNCEGAYYSGLETIVFHLDAAELRQKLADLGVNISC